MISVSELSVTYASGYQALKPVSLQFRRGELTVLLGASGAGKSTLLRCLNGLVAPSAGQVGSAHHPDIVASAETLRDHRRRTGMIFQHHQLIPRRSALQNVLTGRLSFHSPWRTLFPLLAHDLHLALACLNRVGLLAHANARVDRLSGGQQQRVGIARALVSQPEVLIADEPVASLDPAAADSVMDLIKQVCGQDGLTTVVSLHQLALARRIADRIIGIRGGEVVFDGAPRELCEAAVTSIYAGIGEPVSRKPAPSSQPLAEALAHA
ncbi:MAG: Arginine transport ATP-binding protein ArtM [Herbaspirillum frisingense]|uniref:Arginine transport ATP-binding protein ArtM n=1 Tax=Herbaspirillum frisingense TaxID=92645 RepID=A0A7V8JTQ4_9BURK|nr:MAG: Arginine transport ATP-binding protein ArtM [Herbaspirillum frisingense]